MHPPGFGVLRARILTPFSHPYAVVWWSCLLLRTVVSEKEAGVQRHLLTIISFGGRVKSHSAAIRFARLQYPGLGVLRRCDFAELSADRDGEMWLYSRIYSAIRALVNRSEIHDTHPLW